MAWKFFVEQQPWRMFRERLHITRDVGPHGDDFQVVQQLEFKTYTNRLPIPEDMCALSSDNMGRNIVRDFLQAGLDAAWDLGLRPTAYKDHTLELAATRAHLDDMRTIVAGKLAVPLMLRGGAPIIHRPG